MNIWGFLKPIEIVVSYIFYYIHEGLTLIGFSKGAGPAWIISIVILTVIIRACLLPLFIKTIHATRKMQTLQPEIKAIQNKYKNKKDNESKQAQQKELMELYKIHNANPASSCLPILIQAPFFFSLYRTLSGIKGISEGNETIGAINQNVAIDIEGSHFFGIHLSDTFQTVPFQGGQLIIGALIACMCISMFVSQKIVTSKNTPQITKESPQFGIQKNMMYIMPLMYIFSGAIFPLGVLIYWLTTNLWTLGQGLWQIHYMPTPGSDAAENKLARDKKKEELLKEQIRTEDPETYEKVYQQPDERKQQRQQPKKRKSKK